MIRLDIFVQVWFLTGQTQTEYLQVKSTLYCPSIQIQILIQKLQIKIHLNGTFPFIRKIIRNLYKHADRKVKNMCTGFLFGSARLEGISLAYTRTHAYTHARIHTHARTHTHTNTHTHAHTHTHMRTSHTRTSIIHIHSSTCTHARTHTHTHTRIRTPHTQTHTHTHTIVLVVRQSHSNGVNWKCPASLYEHSCLVSWGPLWATAWRILMEALGEIYTSIVTF
jgi:hypothetical protein